MTLDLVEKENTKLKANNNTSNAHCTIMTQAVMTARANLDCQKHTTHRAVKTSACYVAHPAIEDEWNASQQEKAQCAKEVAEMEAQKATEEALCEAHIQEEIQSRSFSSKSSSDLYTFHFNSNCFVDPLSSYKWKDDLVALSGALGLKITGTVHKLLMQIKSHLNVHPEIQQNAHFSGLFLPSWQVHNHSSR